MIPYFLRYPSIPSFFLIPFDLFSFPSLPSTNRGKYSVGKEGVGSKLGQLSISHILFHCRITRLGGWFVCVPFPKCVSGIACNYHHLLFFSSFFNFFLVILQNGK